MIPDLFFDDDTQAAIQSVTWVEDCLLVGVRLLDDDSEWTIICKEPLRWRMEERHFSGLRLLFDAPVLWPVNFAGCSTYFKGTPKEPHRAACDVLSAIPDLMRTPNALADLLSTGNGSLGHLPLPAARLCESVLGQYGIEVYSLPSSPQVRTREASALYISEYSYIVAERFDAVPGAPGVNV